MKTLFLCLLLLSSASAFGQAGYAWVNQLNSSSNSTSANAVVTDAAGNSYVTGSFSGTAQWGNFTLTSRGQTDLYVVKYNPAGRAQWVARIGNDLSAPDPYSINYARNTANGTAISLDGQGNVYITGGFTGQVSDDSGTQLTTTTEGTFTTALIAKLSSRGQVQWGRRFGTPQFGCYAYDIATDAMGNSYVTGQSDYGGIRFGDLVVGGSRRVMFLARYTAAGAVSWAHVSSNYSSYGASGSAVLLDKQGNCLLGGSFNHDMVLAGASLSISGTDSYLASFEPATGQLRWIQQGGGSGGTIISKLALDRQGNIYAAGHYDNENSTLNGQALPAFGGFTNVFLARYSPGGALQWVRPMGTGASEYATGLATEPDGTSTLLSTFYPPAGSSQPQQTLLQTFLPDGSLYHTETLGTTGSCAVRDVACLTQPGQLVLAGNLSGAAQFGPRNVQMPTGTAGFVASRRLHTPPSGASHSSQPTLEVSPNPAHGQLTARLSWSNAGLLLPGQATLLTFMGKVVATQPLVATGAAQVQAHFDCGNLPAGLYVLQLRTTDGLTHSQGVAIQ